MEIKDINNKERAYIFIITIISLLSCILINISLVFGFLISIIITSILIMKRGYDIKQLLSMIIKGLSECKTLYLLIILIGANISVWLSSGVVPTMIYYGFKYINGINFLFASFMITSIISFFMGTALGTLSTIGIALFGIGKGLGIPPHILLGSIISGAFIADKISPISGLLNLTLTSTNVKYNKAIKSMLITLIPTYIITAIIYYLIGIKYSYNAYSNFDKYINAIENSFYISPYLLILPLVILFLSIKGFDVVKNIFIGLIVGVIISLTLQNSDFMHVIRYIIFGYKGNTALIELNKILVSGGIVSMIEVLLIVMGAIILNSIFEGTNIIQPIINNIIKNVKNEGDLIIKTGFISSFLTILTCDQTVGIILPGRLLKRKYEEYNIDRSILARTISDSGTIIAPLMPWNVNALIITLISGVSAVKYSVFAVLCYISPIITIIFALVFNRNSKILKSTS